jgi:ATP-dependent Clp protease protease subunit
MAKFYTFINKAATETEPESVELRIEGDIVDDDDVWLYELYGEKSTSPNLFKAELAKHEGKPLTMWIDSNGGSVFAATGIYTSLMERKGHTEAKIIKAMSAATIPPMAAGTVSMSPPGMFMLHNPLTEARGYASDFRKVADILDEVKEAIMNAYQLKTGRSRAKISELMDAETYMNARTAIKEGFVDKMLYSENAEPIEMSFSRCTISNNTFEAVKRMVALQRPKPEDNTLALAKLKLQLQL